ncbi:MAG: glutamine--tRNA ligase/YqeY domain fusion protein [marine benthic group bacterium]|jgi:glutaminyl-tRNA synthetase|nr:glutamine--tRNA ligase/YqeY domain fusion protein [Gemmatimonadota bacterium]MCL7981128.1 glutamine--tRNA ligase/YqeY domain fusion protein [Gemmatimonadota bacterium]MCL7985368.1 glutamine--tRNA ligase/YqeY domain fusion protein [Gemmatimonadota bacterium]
MAESDAEGTVESKDFLRTKIENDIRTGKYGGRVATRFPPEPNGYLHIGHAKSICLNFGVAEEYAGTCNLRYDDTNPDTATQEFVDSMQADIRWLGYDWEDRLYFASDYFEQFYEWAEKLVREDKAYVDSSSEEEIRELRGTVTEPGRPSPYRERTPEENLDLLRRMKAGEFPNGAHVLRAKIDMAHPNMVMRDPLLLRIRHSTHYRRGDEWCLYPMYDYAHCLEDAIEDITHSFCTLEFRNNREIYDWVLDAVGIERPRTEQTEFARLELDYTVLSKRRLIRLVNEGHVAGWDDPRMPTIAGIRRRGVTPEAVRSLCEKVGVADVKSRTDYALFEYAIRDDLNWRSPRRLAVLDPLKVVITDYPEDAEEWIDAPSFPRDVDKEGSRRMPFSRELWIERADFMEEPPRKFHRLAPGREVRLRHAYVIRCDEVVKDPETGEVIELRCSHDPATMGANPADGRRIKGTIHWVSARHALPAEVRLYDRLFAVADPDEGLEEGEDFTKNLNPESLVVVNPARVEPSLADDPPGSRYQFERSGYFVSDALDSAPGALVFNRTVTLRDSWAKIAARS